MHSKPFLIARAIQHGLELFDHTERKVIRLTGGLQRPRLRGFNSDNVFPVARLR